ncbi:MAG: clan AA aspartic protease [Armatimonadetes bacterium]|nr:clan AA aspartic protease [Armatimonadota bacterium]
MSVPFNPRRGLIVVTARIWGQRGDAVARLALDTGATSTVIRMELVRRIGYDPAAAAGHARVSTGSGAAHAPLFQLDRIEALEQQRGGLTVVAHNLPPWAPVEDVLGLDFLRGQKLVIDFRAGELSLT